jgi:predicted ATPase/DNA-binding CsgD family transcriptional regulator
MSTATSHEPGDDRLIDIAPERPVSQANVPAPVTALIGREGEVAALSALLGRTDVRLVTLTGPGGVGKTSLSIAVAMEMADAFADGAVFVDLAPIRDAALVAAAIARQLGLREGGSIPPQDRLRLHLRRRELLLVLDNIEQVVEAAQMVGELLAACPGLTVLATSRARLHLSGEQVYLVPTLALPDPDHPATPGRLGTVAAVRLFVERARAADARFALTVANAPAVAEICRRLDGLPLAIELAAARSAVLPAPALLERLEPRLPVLTGGAVDLPVRLQTVRNAIAWSYDLLTEPERRLLGRLALFAGGFTLGAAEAVAGGEAERPKGGKADRRTAGQDRTKPDTFGHAHGDSQSYGITVSEAVLNGIESLVDESLLRRESAAVPADAVPRFGMLETIREFARERLAAGGDEPEARRRHAAYFLALAEGAEPKLRRPEQVATLARLQTEHDNLRGALAWGLAAPAGDETALRLAGALHFFWFLRGHYDEGWRWLDAALERAGAEERSPARAKALAGAGMLAFNRDNYAAARERLAASAALARELGDTAGVAYALHLLARGDLPRREPAALRVLLEESIGLAREAGDRWTLANALCTAGMLATGAGQHAEAAAALDESLALARELGDTWGLARVLHCAGELARARGDDARARVRYEESIPLRHALGDHFTAATALHNLGYVAQHQGDLPRALSCFAEGLAEHAKHGDREKIGLCLAGVAGTVGLLGRAEPAARLFGTAAAAIESTGTPIWPVDRVDYERNLATVRSRLGEATFEAVFDAGRSLPLEQAVAEAAVIAFELQGAGIAADLLAGLTPREREVLRLLAHRLSDKEIAAELSVSPRTVMHHVSSLLGKLGLTSRREAAAWAAQNEMD